MSDREAHDVADALLAGRKGMDDFANVMNEAGHGELCFCPDCLNEDKVRGLLGQLSEMQKKATHYFIWMRFYEGLCNHLERGGTREDFNQTPVYREWNDHHYKFLAVPTWPEIVLEAV